VNFYIYASNGKKFGPYTHAQVKEFAAKGQVTPQTPMETDTGHKGLAGSISGLFPPKPLPPTPPPSAPKPESIEAQIKSVLNQGGVLVKKIDIFGRKIEARQQKIIDMGAYTNGLGCVGSIACVVFGLCIFAAHPGFFSFLLIIGLGFGGFHIVRIGIESIVGSPISLDKWDPMVAKWNTNAAQCGSDWNTIKQMLGELGDEYKPDTLT
jgi:hypothetical protein